MRILPLGGAGEVGASAMVVELDGCRLAVDAGVRVGSRVAGDWYPAWSLVAEPVEAMIVTHAHMDHTGGISAAVEAIGDVPWFMTEATRTLIEITQGGGGGEDADRPSNDPAILQRVLTRAITVPFYVPFQPAPHRHPGIWARFIPNGHIMGSAMVVLDGPTERLGLTGDFSVTPTPTAGGLSLATLAALRRERPFDMVISEGTYGVAVHPPVGAERERLVRMLAGLTRRGGKVLIPAFAIGRAQDVVTTLRHAKLQGHFDQVPIYLDGMVLPVTEAYTELAATDSDRGSPLRLLDPALDIRRVTTDDRRRLLADTDGEPAIVIASSGMLMGGRSVQYARAWAGRRRNAIVISGYQDEESPGRHLLGLRRGQRLRLGEGDPVTVKCHFGRYHASAHADGRQIAHVLHTLAPRVIGLVHGEPSALAALAATLPRAEPLVNGQWLTVPPRPQAPFVPPALERVAIEARAIRGWWEHVRSQHEGAWLGEAELLDAIGETEASLARQRSILATLARESPYFRCRERGGRRMYRAVSPERALTTLQEQQAAYTLPVTPGSLVVWHEEGLDASLLWVEREAGDLWEGVVPGSRRTQIPKTAVRLVLDAITQERARGMQASRRRTWLEGVLQEARGADPLPLATLWGFVAAEAPDGCAWQQLLPAVFGQAESLSAAQPIQLALALGGARRFFRLQADGRFVAHPAEEVERDWRVFPAAAVCLAPQPVLAGASRARGLPTGWVSETHARILLEDGQQATVPLHRLLALDGTPYVPEKIPAWRQRRQARQEAGGSAPAREATPPAPAAPAPEAAGEPASRRRNRRRRRRKSRGVS